jgi:hypothetical protein
MVIKKEFTETECKLWNENKNINPKTKRPIKETSPIYKKLLKNCVNVNDNDNDNDNDIYKIVNDFCLLNKPKSNFKINEKDKEIYDKINDLCKIKKLSPVLSSKSVISSDKKKKEIKILTSSYKTTKSIAINDINKNNKILLSYLSNFNKNNCLELTDKQYQYKLNKDILLYKQIGSKSVFGIVYKSKIIKVNDMPKFVSKIQLSTKEFKRELEIFEKLSEYALKNNICHFPILYAKSTCNNIIRDNNYPELLSKAKNNYKNYSIILYELANGDLNSFINKYASNLNSKIWKNIYEQLFMSILLFHSLDLYHGDTHNGNFLYTKIKTGGCFHYKINNIDYYIENIGYKWMIWDYGNTNKLSKLTKISFFDDYKFINLFLRKFDKVINDSKEFKNNSFYSNKKAGYLIENAIIPSDIKKLQDKVWEHLGDLNDKYLINFIFNQNKTEYDWFKYFIDNNLLFSKYPIGVIISTTIIKIN